MRDARTIRETREAVVVIVQAFNAWQSASSDGHVSFHEWVKFAGLIPEFWDAIESAGNIPKELKDLDGLEADELIGLVAHGIEMHVEGNVLRRKIDKILVAFHAVADAVAEWQGVNPPRAEVVP